MSNKETDAKKKRKSERRRRQTEKNEVGESERNPVRVNHLLFDVSFVQLDGKPHGTPVPQLGSVKHRLTLGLLMSSQRSSTLTMFKQRYRCVL